MMAEPPARDSGRAVRLRCPVRECGRPLERRDATVACDAGHAFDVARRAYVNLLLASDRRSATPGDTREAVQARRRYLETGHETQFIDVLRRTLGERAAGLVLDVGCGEGFHMRALGLAGAGVDISKPAIELAARADPSQCWVVANADRALPFADTQFDLVLSITSRRNADEFRRVLAPAGAVVVVVPGPDDLAELRNTVLGRAEARDRTVGLASEMTGAFRLVHRETVRYSAMVDSAALRDVVTATYRGGRSSRLDRLDTLEPMAVTIHREICTFEPHIGSPHSRSPHGRTPHSRSPRNRSR